MARQDLNDMFAQTAFLYGGNAAYLDDLYARYQQNPASVDDEWRGFFSGLKDDSNLIVKNARGASWTKPNWPIAANGELVSALDGNWLEVEGVEIRVEMAAHAIGADHHDGAHAVARRLGDLVGG